MTHKDLNSKNFTSIEDLIDDLEKSAPGIKQEFNKRKKARETTQEIRLKLRNLRKENNMSAKDIAEKTDIPEVDILRFESGTGDVLLETAIRYADVFGKKLWQN